MNDKSAALVRASNIDLLDYPWKASLEGMLAHFDEVIIVADPNSADSTIRLLVAEALKTPRITFSTMNFVWDRMWQQNWWEFATSRTDADWLAWIDLDEVIDPTFCFRLRDMMADESCKLINFPFVHFYATSHYAIDFTLKRNTRIGRRSAGFRMVNKCSDEHPKNAACAVVFGDNEDAHTVEGDFIRQVEFPILHYGWCRLPWALAISQAKHRAWYGDDDIGAEIPEVAPYEFDLGTKIATGEVQAYQGQHPELMREWFNSHSMEWYALSLEAQFRQVSPTVKNIYTLGGNDA